MTLSNPNHFVKALALHGLESVVRLSFHLLKTSQWDEIPTCVSERTKHTKILAVTLIIVSPESSLALSTM